METLFRLTEVGPISVIEKINLVEQMPECPTRIDSSVVCLFRQREQAVRQTSESMKRGRVRPIVNIERVPGDEVKISDRVTPFVQKLWIMTFCLPPWA